MSVGICPGGIVQIHKIHLSSWSVGGQPARHNPLDRNPSPFCCRRRTEPGKVFFGKLETNPFS